MLKELNKEGSLQNGNCVRLNGHKAEELNMGVDMKEMVYHKAAEEGLKFYHKHMSNQ